MKGFTIYSLSKHAELGSLLESYCQRIGKLSSSNHDLDSLFSLLFEVSILFTEEKACYKTMGTVINRQNEIERNIAEMEKGKLHLVSINYGRFLKDCKIHCIMSESLKCISTRKCFINSR